MDQSAAYRLGLLSSLGAMILFCATDAVIKHFVADMPIFLVMALCYVGAVILSGLDARCSKINVLTVTRPRTVAIYGLLYFLEMAVFFYALKFMDFSILFIFVMAIPIVAAKLANILLGELLTLRQHMALLLAFMGVMATVFLKDGNVNLLQVSSIGVLLALLDIAICSSKIVFLRKYGQDENPRVVNFWSLSIMALGALIMLPFEYAPFQWSQNMLWLLALPFGSFAGGLLYALSYRLAPATLVAPVLYSQLIGATVIGVLFFGEELTRPFFAGAALIVLAGLLFYWPERLKAVAA